MDAKSFVHAIIGALVTVVTSFVPLSPVFGGAVAAWLEGGSREDGLLIGTLSGVLVSILLLPLLLIGLLLIPFDLGFTFVLMLVLVFFATLYVVGFSALGGYIGAYLHTEYDSRGRATSAKRSSDGERRTESGSTVDDGTTIDDGTAIDESASLDDTRTIDTEHSDGVSEFDADHR